MTNAHLCWDWDFKQLSVFVKIASHPLIFMHFTVFKRKGESEIEMETKTQSETEQEEGLNPLLKGLGNCAVKSVHS